MTVQVAVRTDSAQLVLRKGWLMSAAVITASIGITAAMSLLFYRSVHPQMIATGIVCAAVIDRLVVRITRRYRAKLAAFHASLEQRVAERTAALERANQELIARDRMATAGTLAAGVSHEIRSPLSVIRIAVDDVADLLERGETGEALPLVRDISDAADRITTIVGDLSSIARPIDDPLGPTELRGVIDSAARLAGYRLGKDVTLVRMPADVPAVTGNGSRLVQLVLNLLINAARATRLDAPNLIRIGATLAPDGDSVILAVSDTGTGMPPDILARVFEPFFTTGGGTGGTGLGLPICRSLVERMGGSISLASTLGAGTTVSVILRRAA